MVRFSKNYKALCNLAEKIFDGLSKCSDLSEIQNDVQSFVSIFNETAPVAKKRQHIALRFLFNRIGYACFLFDELSKLLVDYLHIKETSYFDTWKDYVEYMIIFYDYKVFNYDVMVDAATYYLNNVRFDKVNHDLLLFKIVMYHNEGIIDDNEHKFLDYSYNSELSKPLLEFLQPALNGAKVCISDEEKAIRDDEFKQFVFNNFDTNYKPNVVIKYNNKLKIKLHKRYSRAFTIYEDSFVGDLEKTVTNNILDHQCRTNIFRNVPSPNNLYLYLIEVILGQEHYTCLDKLLIDVVENAQLYIFSASTYDKENANYFNIINKYIMLYFGIGYPKNEIKAMEYLSVNINELTKSPCGVRMLTRYMPYDLHAIISNNASNSTKFINQCLNPAYLSKSKLIKSLDSKLEQAVYDDLKYIKENNIYVFNDIIDRYKEQYDKGVAKDAEDERLRKLREAEEEQKRLEEEEKQRKIQEELERKQKASERLKENLKTKNNILTDAELAELIVKSDDVDAMRKVADHYFGMASKDYKLYNLAYTYYCVVGELGSPLGYYNAAISKSNYNKFIDKDSDEYKENYNMSMEALEKTPHSPRFFFAYAYYAHDHKNEKFTKYIEETYQEILNNPKILENGKNLIKSGYCFYHDDYYNCVQYFDEVKEFVDKSLLSMFTNRVFDKVYETTRKVKPPVYDDGKFINPFSEEYSSFRRQQAAYSTAVQCIAKTKEIIDWACTLDDVNSNKYKAYCLYYGIFNYEKNHKEAYDIFSRYEDGILYNEKTYRKIWEELKKEFGAPKRKRK